jgi:hypothetical protein
MGGAHRQHTILQGALYDLAELLGCRRVWVRFHRFWDGVLLCLNVCIAKGSEASRSRRHTCNCGLWAGWIICDILITCTKLGLCSGGSKSTSKRVFLDILRGSKHIGRVEVGSGGPLSRSWRKIYMGSSSVFSSLGGTGLILAFLRRGVSFVSNEHVGTS